MRQNLSLIELLPRHRKSSPAVLEWFDVTFRQEPMPAKLHEAARKVDLRRNPRQSGSISRLNRPCAIALQANKTVEIKDGLDPAK
jgi:hypothetical protein